MSIDAPTDMSEIQIPTEALPTPVKGSSDYREYRALRLANSIGVLLVHDPQSQQLAASASVHAGAASDPRSLPGLAHFCEHMCFLGSRRYPGENEYKRYLSQHGGRSNASTSMTHTTFKFDVLAHPPTSDEAFCGVPETALDMFANFFIAPLFTASGTEREVNAVDSENSKNLTSDLRRRLQVLKDLADARHSYSKFSTGNANTLFASNSADSANGVHSAPFVRAALLAFHQRHYRPRNMTVVVVGPQSLDQLEAWVAPRFGSIPDRWLNNADNADNATNGDIDPTIANEAKRLVDEAAAEAPDVTYGSPPPEYRPAFSPEFNGGQWPVLLTTLPLKSIRKLVLLFPLPPTSWHSPDQSPTRLLSHLFGHEGPGSCFALLQNRGYIASLSAGNRISAPDQSLFQLDMSLTQTGEEHWEEVVGVIFSYARLLQRTVRREMSQISNSVSEATTEATTEALNEKPLESNPEPIKSPGSPKSPTDSPLRRIYQEMSTLAQMHFHQTSPGQAYDLAPTLAQSVSKNGTRNALSAGSLLHETGDTLDMDSLLQFVDKIVPENCIVERCSKAAWEEMKSRYSTQDDADATHHVTRDNSNGFAFGKRTEPWYGVEYYLSPLEDTALWREDGDNGVFQGLHLPQPNRFIPRSLELCPDLPEEARRGPRIEKAIDPPKLIVNSPGVGRLWWRLDDRYALPKSSLRLLLRTATAENKQTLPITQGATDAAESKTTSATWSFDPQISMQSLMLTNVFADASAQDTYDADLAGLGWSLSKSSSGYTLTCDGYSDRLSDLGLKLLQDFLQEGNFIRESHFATTKDRIVRSLRSFFESRRADSQAIYYRDLLLSSKGAGIEKNLAVAEGMTLEDIMKQHQTLVMDDDLKLECLYTGNVSEGEARAFFESAVGIIEKSRGFTREKSHSKNRYPGDKSIPWVPGPFERRLQSGEDIELHFPSKNPKEENGSVLVTYQSQIPGFKGTSLSSDESLKQTASIRLLCHMLREPLFDELRTKQQLGYVVSSYYDLNFATRQYDFLHTLSHQPHSNTHPLSPLTTPIDSVVINVLSRKETPTEVANRIDDFLFNFRSRLEDIPSSEIQNHAESLANALTKPIRKLGSEAGSHFAKIRRYAPEILCHGHSQDRGKNARQSTTNLPWDSAEALAKTILTLERSDILRVFDSLILSKDSRSKIVSFVYGKTFPMEMDAVKLRHRPVVGERTQSVFLTSSVDELLNKRSAMISYDPTTSYPQRNYGGYREFFGRMGSVRNRNVRYAAATAAVISVGVWGLMMMKGDKAGDKRQSKVNT